MNSAQQWVRDHLWVVTTGSSAAVVFVVAFFAVSAITDDGVAATVASTPVSEPPSTVADDAPSEVVAEPPTDQPPTPVEDVPAPPDTSPVDTGPEPVTSTLPEFDEETLVFGGSGTEGAILAGSGIVPSSRPEDQTFWELLIPSAQVRASIVRVGPVGNNQFGAPDNPQVIGWWSLGPAPGQPGNVLLDGHRDFSDIDGNIGTGVCWLLPNVSVDDFMIVRDNDARVSYVYTIIETASVPWNAPEGASYLQPSEQSLLTLITCEGSFDADSHNYSNRRIIVAEMTDTVPFTS